tara:strand:- start:1077 stop:1274 length:198 start_codon:yes stop_codon:yes gene_type:complete
MAEITSYSVKELISGSFKELTVNDDCRKTLSSARNSWQASSTPTAFISATNVGTASLSRPGHAHS